MVVLDDSFDIVWELYMDLCPPPNLLIDSEALAYNWFTIDRIARGKSYEEFIEFFEIFFHTYFTEEQKPIIVWQYITADLSFLASIFYHWRKPSMYMLLGNDIIDTKSIANEHNARARYLWQELPFKSTSLSKQGWLKEVLGIQGYVAHTAKGDILATREVLLKFFWVHKK